MKNLNFNRLEKLQGGVCEPWPGNAGEPHDDCYNSTRCRVILMISEDFSTPTELNCCADGFTVESITRPSFVTV